MSAFSLSSAGDDWPAAVTFGGRGGGEGPVRLFRCFGVNAAAESTGVDAVRVCDWDTTGGSLVKTSDRMPRRSFSVDFCSMGTMYVSKLNK
jgi:hypothetical protein